MISEIEEEITTDQMSLLCRIFYYIILWAIIEALYYSLYEERL
jgi:hypothetical protein